MSTLHDVAVPRPAVPEVEVVAKATRRRFTAEYKRKILREADACTEPGAIGALLRREGLYSSNLTTWRAQRQRGELAGLTPKQRGPAPKPKNPLAGRVSALEREVTRLTARAQRAEALVELQKKWRSSWGPPGRRPAGKPDGGHHGAPSHLGRGSGVRGAGGAAGLVLPLAEPAGALPGGPPDAAGLAAGGAAARPGGAAR